MIKKERGKKTVVRRITEDEELMINSVRKFGMDNFISTLRNITQTGLNANNLDSLNQFAKYFIPQAPRTLEEAVSMGMITKETLDVLLQAVRDKKSIAFIGNINTGKSTLLRALITHEVIRNQRLTILEKSTSRDVKQSTTETSPLHVLDVTDTCEVLKQILTKPSGYILMDIEEKGDMYTLLNFVKQQPVIFTSCWSLKNHLAMLDVPNLDAVANIFTEDNTLVIQCSTKGGVYKAEVVKDF